MNPGFLDDMSWEMAEVYGAITDQILINLAKHFSFFEADNAPKSTFEYQARMLAQMGQVNRETTRIIRNNLADADLALQGVLEQAIIDAVKGSEPGLLKAVKSGILKPAGTPVVAPNQMRAFTLYYQQAADKLNLVNTVMLESTKSAYQQTISDVVSDIELSERMNATQIALDVATGETLTGVSSWNTALRHATDRLKDRGIIGFVDHGGHQWSAEAYVAMDIRTTVFNTGRAAVWETNQTFGNDLYIVSYHNGARPLCYDWQNKVISSTDNARVITDLYGDEVQVYAQSNTTYGEPAGLFGINCKHYPTPFIPGVSVIEGAPQDPEANAKTYAESQEQRRLERKLREEKRDLMMAKAQGRPQEEIDRLRERCRKSSADIDDFCNSTGRARHRDREAVYTKREFPDKEKYDVTKFEHQQKDLIDQYFKDGGVQQGYTFGEMTPNATETHAPQKPTVKYGKLFDEKAKEVTEETLQALQAEYPLQNVQLGFVGDVRVYEGMDETIDVLDLSSENPRLPDSGAQYRTARSSKDGIPAIVVHNEGYSTTPLKKEFEERAMLRAKYPKITSATAFETVADSLEGTIMHEYAHALADNYGFFLETRTKEGTEFLNWLIDYWERHRDTLITMSKYAASNPAEMFAEAFVQYHDTAHSNTPAYRMAAEIMGEFKRRFIK